MSAGDVAAQRTTGIIALACGHWRRPGITVGALHAYCVKCGEYVDLEPMPRLPPAPSSGASA